MSLQDQLDGLLNFLQEARLCMTADHFQGARAHHVSKFENTLRSLTRISSTEAAGILSKLRSSDCLRPEDVQQLTQPLTIRSAALTHAQASTVQGRTQDYVEFCSFLTQHFDPASLGRDYHARRHGHHRLGHLVQLPCMPWLSSSFGEHDSSFHSSFLAVYAATCSGYLVCCSQARVLFAAKVIPASSSLP